MNSRATSSSETDQQPLLASQALLSEIKAFCGRSGLTPRESEIMSLLVEGVVRIKDIATKLGLSPNTVNNHVNSIFMKSRARSKSQLLANFLNHVAEELQSARFFRQSPKVVRIANSTEEVRADHLSRTLGERGFKLALATPELLENSIAQTSPDFILVDLGALKQADSCEVIRRVRKMSPALVVFMGAGGGCASRLDAMASGAMEWFPRGADDAEGICRLLMCHYIEDDSDRARYLESVAPIMRRAQGQAVALRSENVGAGGLFLTSEDLQTLGFTEAVQPGDFLEMKLAFDHSPEPVLARGEIVWMRNGYEGNARPGAGVRFTYLTLMAREKIGQMVREKAITSYVPAGRAG